MSEKVKYLLLALSFAMMVGSFSAAVAHDDDYIVGLNAFRDGLYDISAPSLEQYLQGDKEQRKADYAHYLLYQMALAKSEYENALKHLTAVDGVEDTRFDTEKMGDDKMFLLTRSDCAGASAHLQKYHSERAMNLFLDSECKVAGSDADVIAKSAAKDDTKLKLISKMEDDQARVTSIFDTLKLEKLSDNSKKFFALYFYKNNDTERYAKVRAVYMDADVAGLELDTLWKSGDKDVFIKRYEELRSEYKLTGANACRAIEIYRKADTKFDCNIINECMQKYSVDFVKIKGACLIKHGDKDQITAFTDSLKPTIFPGMCAYGEYMMHNELYTGSDHKKFYQCDEKYKIADVLLGKNEYQAVVNMFFKKDKDMDRYYAAVALKKLGKAEAADAIAESIKDEALKTKYKGGA